MTWFEVDLTPEEAFKYGTVVASGIAGLIVGFRRWRKKDRSSTGSKCKNCGLCKHELFAFLELQLRKVQHNNWRCCNEYKTRVGRRMIQHKFETGIKRWKVAFCSMQHLTDKQELLERFKEEIGVVVDLYNAKWIDEGINKRIIHQVNDYHNTNVRYALRLANLEIGRDYQSTRETLRNIMTALIIPYTVFLSDVRNVLDNANGDLKDDIFEGVVNTNERIDLNLDTARYSFDEEMN